MANDSIVNKITDKDLEVIRSVLDSMIPGLTEHVTAADVFEKVGEKLSTQMLKTTFCPALSANISSGRLAGFHSRKGRHGGIFRGEENKKAAVAVTVSKPAVTDIGLKRIEVGLIDIPENPVIQPKKESEPKPYLAAKRPVTTDNEPLKNTLYDPSQKFEMFIQDERYSVPANRLYIRVLLDKVFGAKEDPNGTVRYEGKIYSVSNDVILADTLMWFINASLIRTSDSPNQEPLKDFVHFLDRKDKSNRIVSEVVTEEQNESLP